ncbi:hypothetical protein Cs7R123_46200 [Catellatospora sp. TT07R-123]|uniref:ricin-type beta-trefoil lectin domain protein n=1 Tax=Catellatospora sp. TT07R-123 TaxID=2733863 RepID=UPI001B27ED8B|nr:ricin-type beta-trefoil lectin domain protein [Catellatospora sp. TT07R-123]GHJ47278.1 hypothetical protein Cs7R123_46200 [Catellatospora sp. TT07R-123]
MDGVFDEKTSTRLADKSTRNSTAYRNADGSFTRRLFTGPVNYRAGDGTWTPIDTKLAKRGDGRLHVAANTVDTSIAAQTTPGTAWVTLPLAADQSVGFWLDGAASVQPTIEGSTALYRDVLPYTDAELAATPTVVKDTLILRSPLAANSWLFPLQTKGLTPRIGADGGVEFTDSTGVVRAGIRPGHMEDSYVRLPSGDRSSSDEVTYTLEDHAGGYALRVTASRQWLSDPARVYPVRVDPPIEPISTYTSDDVFVDNDSSTGTSKQDGDDLAVGYDGEGKARSFIHFNDFDDQGFLGTRITGATLKLYHTWSWDCVTHLPVYVHKVLQSWTVSALKQDDTYPGPSISSPIGTLQIDDNYPACQNTSGNRSTGEWRSVTLNPATFNDWSTGGANNGLALTASESNAAGWKRFTSDNYVGDALSPELVLTYAPNTAPQVSAQYPANGYNSPTLTPELLATAVDQDAFPKSLTYKFIIFDKDAEVLHESQAQSTRSFQVPTGLLNWNETYLWTVVASDGALTSGQTMNVLRTPVPQPLTTSSLSSNGGKGFDPMAGNFTTEATDAVVATVGPALSLTRSYNSQDPRTNAFGRGWATLADAKVTERGSGGGRTVVVTYPSGREAGFGRNADGTTFTAPPGRYESLRQISGGYELTEKNGTAWTYTKVLATGQWALTSVRDMQGRTMTVTYTGNELYQLTAASGRKLTFNWSTIAGASTRHVTSVVTDKAVASDPTSTQTWNYSYLGDKLAGFCPPTTTTACTSYTYETNSVAQGMTLNIGPHSYWRLNETTGATSAASSVIANGQTDQGTYAGSVTLGQTGPLAGGATSAAGFNGSSARVALPADLASNATFQSVSMWFKTTTATDGVLLGQSWDPVTSSTTTGAYNPTLYIGANGKLVGQFPTVPKPETVGSFVGYGSGRCLDVEDGLAVNGARLMIYDCAGGADQQWTLTAAGELRTTIGGVTKCVDAQAAGLVDGTDVQLWSCNSGNNQKWVPLADGRIMGLQSGKCLDAELNHTTNGTYIQLWSCGSVRKTNQAWFATTHSPLQTTGSVADGQWHHVVLTANGTSQTMYVDGTFVGTKSDAAIADIDPVYNYLGVGFLGGQWPNQTHTNTIKNTGTLDYFTGSIAEVSVFDRPLDEEAIAQLYRARQSVDLLTNVGKPRGGASAHVTYNPKTGMLATVTDAHGSVWQTSTPALERSGTAYAGAVLGAAPTDYWRLAETGTLTATNQVNGHTATYNVVTLNNTGGPFTDTKVASFNGTTSYLQTGTDVIAPTTTGSVGMWFQTSTPGRVLAAHDNRPVLWIGADGLLRGAAPGTAATGPITSVPGGVTKCMDVSSSHPGWVVIHTCHGGTNQSWTLQADQTLRSGGKCLQVAGTAAGSLATAVTCPTTPTTAQLWESYNGGLRNPISGRCLDIPSSSTVDQTQMQLWTCNGTPAQKWTQGVTAANRVDDGKWHHVVLTGTDTVQTLYLDGIPATTTDASARAAAQPAALRVGGGATGNGLAGLGGGTTSYFNGKISDIAVYATALTNEQVNDQFTVRDTSIDITGVTAVVTDPASQQLTYIHDTSNRIVAESDALGHFTLYGYDTGGFLRTVTDPNGNMSINEHDVRGNTLATTTCQDRSANKCSTTYYVYDGYPTRDAKVLTPDPRNDQVLEVRDVRSNSPTDNRYLTTFTYDTAGNRTAVTSPVTDTTTRTSTIAYTGANTDVALDPATYAPTSPAVYVPAGLAKQSVSATGAVQTNAYFATGDVAQTTDATGKITRYAYDGLGRTTSQTEITETFPGGLTTQLGYDKLNRVTTVTSPGVLNRVTGAVHTAVITKVYDDDGNLLSQTVDDTTGSDDDRSVSSTFNLLGQQLTATDARGKTSSFTYDEFGRIETQTAPDGTVTRTDYDPAGNVLDTVIVNWTGSPNNPLPLPVELTLQSNTYDPAGRLASTVDADGWTNTYTYTDNNLPAKVTRTDGTNTFIYQQSTYDSAGNLIEQLTNNGTTKTTYTVDNAGRRTKTVVDPGGLNRTTELVYALNDTLLASKITDGGSAVGEYAESLFDPAGRQIASTTYTSTGLTPVAWWKLDETSGTTAADASGNSPATATAVTWASGKASFNGTSSWIGSTGPLMDTTASFTVSAWVNLADKSVDRVVAATTSVDSGAMNIRYQKSSDRWVFQMPSVSAAPQTFYTATSTSVPATGVDTHLTAVYDGPAKQMKLYVNGSLQATVSNVVAFNDHLSDFRIGRSRGGYFSGSIDDVRVFTKALASTDVSAVYNNTAPANRVIRTYYSRDNAGLVKSVRDPNGNTTDLAYDEAGRAVVTTAPAVLTETYGNSPVLARPVTSVGFDTFGQQTHSKDPFGKVTTNTYNHGGMLLTSTGAAYTPPGSGTPITPVVSNTYDTLGRLKTTTDPRGKTSTNSYDQLNRVASVTAPDGGITRYSYTNTGALLQTTDPTGAVTAATYDYLGRLDNSSTTERLPSPATFTTDYHYNAAGWLYTVTSPRGVTTTYTSYNAAGQPLTVTDDVGNATTYLYDTAGRRTRTTATDGSYTQTDYDLAGRPTATTEDAATGPLVRTTSATYDNAGNVLSSTDARGTTSTFTYDATGALVSQIQPASATESITTSFGHDLAGNTTRFTNGRGDAFYTTYNPWGLPESTIEPATTAYPNAADRTRTITYDAAGNPVTQTLPGGITTTTTYDDMGQVTAQTGTGAEATTANRSYGYDLAGRLTTLSGPGGSNTLTYNDRGQLGSVTGPTGNSTFTYNTDTQLALRDDAAGQTAYDYDNDGRLSTITNNANGVAVQYGYNTLSQPTSVSYSSGNTRWISYDGLHRITTDDLRTPGGPTGGTSIASINYTFDLNNNETRKITTGFAGAADNNYSYDLADRLHTWNNGTTTTTYEYDRAGNRTQAGSRVFNYNQRNQLTTDNQGNSYTYTARGTLRQKSTGTVALDTLADAYGQVAKQYTSATAFEQYDYDGLGRLIKTGFTYTGTGNTLASDGTTLYTRGPAGGVIGEKTGTDKRLAWTDLHTDVVAQFTPTGTALAGSTAYDPLGKTLATTAMTGGLGYQSEWTETSTGRVNMHARWYNTDTGQFDTGDTVANSPVPNSINANRYGYANANPLTITDPTGHYITEFSDAVFNDTGDWDSPGRAELNNARIQREKAIDKMLTDKQTAIINSMPFCQRPGVAATHSECPFAQTYGGSGFNSRTGVGSGSNPKSCPHSNSDWTYANCTTVATDANGNVYVNDVKIGNKKDLGTLTIAGIGAQVDKLITNYGGGYTYEGDRLFLLSLVIDDAIWNAAQEQQAQDERISKAKCDASVICSYVEPATFVLGLAAGIACGAISAGALAAVCMIGTSAALNVATDAAKGNIHSWQDAGVSMLYGGATGLLSMATGGLGGKIASGLLSRAGGGLLTRMATGALGGALGDAGSQFVLTGRIDPLGIALAAGFGAAGGFGCKHSFDPSTEVLMADGAHKAIKDVAVGDRVIATDPETGHTTSQPVTDLHRNLDTDLTDVTVSTAAQPVGEHSDVDGSEGRSTRGPTTVLHTTSHHPFWDAATETWKDAADLVPHESVLVSPEGNTLVVVKVHSYTGAKEMRDLTVDAFHTYYVIAGSTPVLVHNCLKSVADDLQTQAVNNQTVGQAVRINADGTVNRLGSPLASGGSPLARQVAAYLEGIGVKGPHDGKYPFVAAEHPDTQFAYLLRNNKSGQTSADVVITKVGGPCEGPYSCSVAIPRILPAGWSMTVHYPNASGGMSKTTYDGIGSQP